MAALQALLGEQRSRLETQQRLLEHQVEEVTLRDQKIAKLEHHIAVLTKMVFGPSSEKSPRGEREEAPLFQQGHLFLKEITAAAQALAEQKQVVATVSLPSEGTPTPRPARKGRRTDFPPDLPRVKTTLELLPEQRVCCGTEMTPMGEEVSRQLERVETFVVHEIARVKYCCRVCQDHVRIAPGPDRVIDKGLLGTGALAHGISERFGNHLPYHRLEKKYQAEGIHLSRSVLCRSALQCAELLQPIWKQMIREITAGDLIQTDDTPVVLEESSLGGRKLGRMWIYRDLAHRQAYDFTESRSRDGPAAILKDFAGFLQADAYAGYDVFFGPGSKVTEVGCWAHCRRYYKRALDSEKTLAAEALAQIQTLYRIERAAKEQGLSAEEVRARRHEQAVPVLEHFQTWLELTRTQVLHQGPMAKAIGYTLSNWTALTRYTTDGRIPLDNNAAERGLRAVAVGRKNWSQIGSVRGGQGAAVLYSLVQTCKAIGVDPRTYLHDVLERIARESDVRKLTPHGWKEHFAAAVTAQRQEIVAAAVAAR